MRYSDDTSWRSAKEVARSGGFKNKWIETIDYYNLNEGKHVNIYYTNDNQKYRILYILDNDDVLLLDKDNNFVTEDYNEVDEGRKVFFFENNPEYVKRDLPDGLTFIDQDWIEYYE